MFEGKEIFTLIPKKIKIHLMVTNTFLTFGKCRVHNHLLYFLPVILKSVLVSQIYPILSCFQVFVLFSPMETPIITMFPPNCEAGPDIPNLKCTHPLNPERAPFYYSFCIIYPPLPWSYVCSSCAYYQHVVFKEKELNPLPSAPLRAHTENAINTCDI